MEDLTPFASIITRVTALIPAPCAVVLRNSKIAFASEIAYHYSFPRIPPRSSVNHYIKTDKFKDCTFACYINFLPCKDGCEKIDDIPIYHPGPKDPKDPYNNPNDPPGPILPHCTETPKGWVCQDPLKK
jgi:hypothetical protein